MTHLSTSGYNCLLLTQLPDCCFISNCIILCKSAPHILCMFDIYASTLRPSCLALCYSAAEYACPVWARSTHAHNLNPALHDCCRIISGCLKPNELGQRTHTGRYRSSSHQEDCCMPHGTHKTNDRHQLFHHQPAASRLKSRKSFMRTVTPLDSSASSSRLQLWKDSLTDVPASVKMGLEVAESLSAGSGGLALLASP